MDWSHHWLITRGSGSAPDAVSLGIEAHPSGRSRCLPIPLLLLLNQGGSMDYQQRFDVPLTYQQAVNETEIDFHFPPQAVKSTTPHLRIGKLAGCFVRFEAPVDDCLSHLETVTAWFNSMDSARNTWETTEIRPSSHTGPSPSGTLIGLLPWFDVGRIKMASHTASFSG